MTPKDLRALASDKALDIGTAWNALEAAADQIEGLTSRLIESKRKLVEARAALNEGRPEPDAVATKTGGAMTIEQNLVEIRNALIKLGITSEKLFESIWSDIQTGRIHGARQQLNFIDKIVEPPAPAPAPAFTPDYWRQRGFRLKWRFPGEYDLWLHPGTLQHLRLYDDGSQWLQDAQTGEYKLVEQGEPPAHAPDCAEAMVGIGRQEVQNEV